MISRLQLPNVKVLSLTTIASPHRGTIYSTRVPMPLVLLKDSGSAFADHLFKQIGRKAISTVVIIRSDATTATQLPKLYKVLEIFGIESGAFSQLTRDYMLNEFNPKIPDLSSVRYATKICG